MKDFRCVLQLLSLILFTYYFVIVLYIYINHQATFKFTEQTYKQLQTEN